MDSRVEMRCSTQNASMEQKNERGTQRVAFVQNSQLQSWQPSQVLATGHLPKGTCQGGSVALSEAAGQNAQRAISEQLTQDRAVPFALVACTRYL